MTIEQLRESLTVFGNTNQTVFKLRNAPVQVGPIVELKHDLIMLNTPWSNGMGYSQYVTTPAEVRAVYKAS